LSRSNGHAKTIETSTTVVLIIFVALGALATAWQWTPLRDWFDLAQALDGLKGLDHTPVTVLIVLAAFPLSGLVMLPSMVLILATIALFGPVVGTAYAVLGCLLSASASYVLGRLLGRQHLGRLRRRLDQIGHLLGGREVLMVAMINWSMIVNLGLIGLAAGMLRFRFARYLLGTLIGIVPGILALALMENSLERTVRDPSLVNVGILFAIGVAIVLAGLWAARQQRE
jgi:uncharacterized membrane protein YdjX (TVP38/TMEM64 family)